ncbi:MAG TPA: hypothetical protein VI756_26130, partial [Blastocatellia bacterium]
MPQPASACWCLAVLLSAGFLSPVVSKQSAAPKSAKKPINEEGLIDAIRSRGMPAKELIARVEERGVGFRLTDAIEARLRHAGAGPKLIDAVRANYRPAYNYSVPAGPPLSPDEIIELLQSGMGSDRVQQYVETLGVAFVLNSEIINRIKAAGGSAALIGTIAESSGSQPDASPNDSDAVGPADYDEL